MALKQRDTLISTADRCLCVVNFHGLAHFGTKHKLNNFLNLLMISVGVKFDRSVKELLVSEMNLFVVLACHNIVITLPVLDLL
jgi:hypothetical protein